ncbi:MULTISPECIES: plasmid partitioning protein RepB [Rhizobium]|jgi:ParB family transcriptional regulator, chromosome partitioning protein|uniref:plasmid partitioning protein RepB n=1 Tax=Rhizobium TaxID=379 RepID=UPI0007E960FC|nr:MULTISPECIES: plasmid partitioning protein RepB [Rhizobium]ANK95563.1 plasmid partitioning protein RepB 4-1 [Rhizobium sp. N6212]ANL01615.1 plasmid partitioning protein RepB 4-1 [Rhizobium sp. N621]ANL07743.1 plasmid partitioning protein RepB 4-1 [Rhizobium esperanzae]ANL13914.1 plasmid partitioning protein RepB 5-1 [Rhizobium sp. N1341]ANL25896.1 plasmid partitioning protein RepB 4-1 [Rhizobium sp. N113]
MARKNLLEGLADMPDENAGAPNYPMRGAGRSLVRSLDELAKQAEKFLEGEAVVDLDPDLVEASFVKDRLSEDDEDFQALVEAIRARGQDTPILVRPHARIDGRYQVVFGHRRLRAARELGRNVRAVVKAIDDRTHVIAQGQENSARADLTFIERALFARRLVELGYDREVVSTALAANAASVSKMLSVMNRISPELVQAIGPAPGVGRERWVELSLLAGKAANAASIAKVLQDDNFHQISSDKRFEALYAALNKSARPVKKTVAARKVTWQPLDKAVQAEMKNDGKAFSLSMKARNAGRFGEFLSGRLDALYEQFLAEEGKQGD